MHNDDCLLEPRLTAAEKRADAHSVRIERTETALADGRVQFAEVRKDLQALTSALQSLVTEVRAERAAKPTFLNKVADAAIHWGVPLVLGGLLWAIVQSRAVAP
jgi:uncharacterized coiled-coil protein SlyX